MWTLLLLTLPSRPTALRLRLWRALKAEGCAALRDGAFLLPSARASAFETVATQAAAGGGQAALFELAARDAAQQQALLALFDRSPLYAQWRGGTLAALRKELPRLIENAAHRRLRTVAEALQAIRRIDDFAGPAADQAQSDFDALAAALDARFAPGEPRARRAAVALLDRNKYRGRRWATRARPKVDRLASAWLIHRFIDPEARFVWFDAARKPPRGTLGFDFDGATFSHVGVRVTFEVLLASFGLEGDAALRKLAALVHVLDVGGIPVAEAAGLDAVLDGLRGLHDDDDLLAAHAAAVFDALYAQALQST